MKKLLFLLPLALSATLAYADQNDLIIENPKDQYAFVSVVPKCMSSDVDSRLLIRSDATEVSVYNKDFTLQKTIAVTLSDSLQKMYVHKEKPVTSWNVELDGYDKTVICYNIPETWTHDSIVEFATFYYQQGITHSACSLGSWTDYYILSNTQYYNENKYGHNYPTSFCVVEDNNLYGVYNVCYRETPNGYGDWQEISREERHFYDQQLAGFAFSDVDNETFTGGPFGNQMGDGVLASQTLFNTDDNFEYIRFKAANGFPSTPEYYYENNNMRDEYYYQYFNGLEILSQNGSVLKTINFPSNFRKFGTYGIDVMKMSNIYYLFIYGYIDAKYEEDAQNGLIIYKIGNVGGTSIEQVSAPIRLPIRKIIKDGHMYIDTNKQIFDALGREIQ